MSFASVTILAFQKTWIETLHCQIQNFRSFADQSPRIATFIFPIRFERISQALACRCCLHGAHCNWSVFTRFFTLDSFRADWHARKVRGVQALTTIALAASYFSTLAELGLD